MDFLKGENEFDTTFEKAMTEIDPAWQSYDGVVVLGSHFPSNTEEKLAKIKYARENNVPFLGICFGLQLAAIEYARNVMGIQNATSEEFSDGYIGLRVVDKMPIGRTGVYPVYWPDGVVSFENFWHNYKVAEEIIPFLSKTFQVNVNKREKIVEAIRLSGHRYFVAVQFHPEYSSSKKENHPILKNFINECKSYKSYKK